MIIKCKQIAAQKIFRLVWKKPGAEGFPETSPQTPKEAAEHALKNLRRKIGTPPTPPAKPPTDVPPGPGPEPEPEPVPTPPLPHQLPDGGVLPSKPPPGPLPSSPGINPGLPPDTSDQLPPEKAFPSLQPLIEGPQGLKKIEDKFYLDNQGNDITAKVTENQEALSKIQPLRDTIMEAVLYKGIVENWTENEIKTVLTEKIKTLRDYCLHPTVYFWKLNNFAQLKRPGGRPAEHNKALADRWILKNNKVKEIKDELIKREQKAYEDTLGEDSYWFFKTGKTGYYSMIQEKIIPLERERRINEAIVWNFPEEDDIDDVYDDHENWVESMYEKAKD